MKIKTIQDVSNVEKWEDLRRYCSQIFQAIVTTINGDIDLVDNCTTTFLTYTFAAPNTTYAVDHTLGKTPNGYIMVSSTSSNTVFDGQGTNNSSKIFLQASAIGTVKLLIF